MADDFDILLIEDNPGDARLIEEMLRDADGLLQRVDPDRTITEPPQLHHEQRLSSGLDALEETDVEVILLDLNLPDSTGLDTLKTVVEATELMPIIVLTGMDGADLGIQAIQRGAQDYLVKNEVTSDVLTRSIHHAIERTRQERRRARHREQLKALNDLNRIAQDVTHIVITTSTRPDLEQAVCDRLVESDAYRFAWIGDVERGSDRVSPRTTAGVEESYLDEISITVDDSETATGPTGRAFETRDVQVQQNIEADQGFEPWREEALERGFQSSAAIPIVNEDLLYGVLNVYATDPEAFSGPEVEILERLGEVIGHAITAIERKDALVGDVFLELEFRVDDLAQELVALTADGSRRIVIENLVQSDDTYLAYGTAVEIPREQFLEAAERTEAVDDVRIVTGGDDEYEFELVVGTVSSLFEGIATHGGHVRSITIADGEFRFVTHFPRGRDTRQLIDLIEEYSPSASLVAQRTVQRHGDDATDLRSFLDDLTDRQRAVIETAYVSGYFEWPRASTGEEIADRFDISPPTFSQHLRSAERKFFGAVFEDDPDEDEPR